MMVVVVVVVVAARILSSILSLRFLEMKVVTIPSDFILPWFIVVLIHLLLMMMVVVVVVVVALCCSFLFFGNNFFSGPSQLGWLCRLRSCFFCDDDIQKL